MIRAVFVQNETLGAYKTEVTIFTGRSVSISESHLENVLWALFLYSTEGALLKCGPKHLISGLLPFFGHREGEENEQYYISRKYSRTEN